VTTQTPSYQQKNFHAVTAYVYGRLDLVDFLVQVLGAKERHRGSNPEQFHGEYEIGDSVIMAGIAKTSPAAFGPPSTWGKAGGAPPPPSTVYVYVPDVDATYQKALAFGAASLGAPENMPWQDRMAGVRDSYGNCWWLATYKG